MHHYQNKRDIPGDFFPMPKAAFRLGLDSGEIAVLAFLMYCEDRKTYQCHPSYSTIGSAVGMSNNTVKKQMFDLKNKIERLDTAQNSSGNFIRAIRKFMTMQTLTPIVLQELIDKIEVFPIEGTGKNRTQRLVIHYRFAGCIDLPSIVPKHTYKLDSRQGVAIEYLPSAV